jgi:predicted DNA-binding transcriptional regulator AlpA
MKNTESKTDRIVRANEGAHILGVSRTTYWRLNKDGKLPPDIQISPRIKGKRLSDLQALLQNDVEE